MYPSAVRVGSSTGLLVALLTFAACGDDAATTDKPGGQGAAGSGAAGTGGSGATSTGGGGVGNGGGGGTGGDPPTACDTAVLGDEHVVAFPGSYSVGPYEITSDAAGRLSAALGNGVVYASPVSGPALQAAQVSLIVEEHQGSFDISESPQTTCASPRFETARTDGSVVQLEGGFDDCQNLRFEMRWCETDEGHLQFRLGTSDPSFNRVTMSLASTPGEHIYGLGEQFPHDTLDLKGRRIPVIAQEGGVGRGHGVISPAVNAFSEGSSGSEDSTYYAVPHILSPRACSRWCWRTPSCRYST